jgi:hypothetical protein
VTLGKQCDQFGTDSRGLSGGYRQRRTAH